MAVRVPDPEVADPLLALAHGHARVEREVVGVAVGEHGVEEDRVAARRKASARLDAKTFWNGGRGLSFWWCRRQTSPFLCLGRNSTN